MAEGSSVSTEVGADAGEEAGVSLGTDPFDWNPVAPYLIHPMKVAIIEAMSYMGHPLSANELRQLLGNMRYVSTVSHHIKGLIAAKALKMVETRRIRGAIEKRYFLIGRTDDR